MAFGVFQLIYGPAIILLTPSLPEQTPSVNIDKLLEFTSEGTLSVWQFEWKLYCIYTSARAVLEKFLTLVPDIMNQVQQGMCRKTWELLLYQNATPVAS